MKFSSDKFYTLFSRFYHEYSSGKVKYLNSVNSFIVKESISPKSMIDVGCGDGKRARKIADVLKINQLVMIDNSDGMIELAKNNLGVTVHKNDISDPGFIIGGRYDLVTHLWNVLGHIPSNNRKTAIDNMSKLVTDNGYIYIDVNNRYNVSHYGFISVLRNILKDILKPNDTNGDFNLKVATPNGQIETLVHIFSPFEIERLIKSSGLKINERKIINYIDGKSCKTIFGGQLLYKISIK